jgi:saccharopine dehydrogenase-like NADP-dependent oxidoreductase
LSRVAVLGAGRIGTLIASDLARDDGIDVRVADRDPEALDRCRSLGLETVRADLGSADGIRRACADCDAVAGAVPGFMGYQVLREVIALGKPAADICFCPEDLLELDGEAGNAGVPVIVDCGVAPGLSNLFAGRSVEELERADSVLIMVGGLPFRRQWPYEYRSVFSPTDVVEEYTRPCRMRENGVERIYPALSGVEPVDVPEVGTLEAFRTDGLRTLLRTLDVPTLVEKTLRYPGHAEKMRMLRETGFFGEEPLRVGGAEVVPRELTERLLFRAWEPMEGEEEFTLLRVVADGEMSGGRRRITWNLFDRTDRETGTTSMARTTGFPCAVLVRMLLAGEWTEPGVHPLENLGRDGALTGRILEELDSRGVRISREEEPLPDGA